MALPVIVSIFDAAPAGIQVPIGGGKAVEVFGIPAHGIPHLLTRFPTLKRLISGKADAGADLETIDNETILNMAPEAIVAVIAAGCGHPGDGRAEEAIAKLPLGIQFDLLTAVKEATVPKGFGSFVTWLHDMGFLTEQPQFSPANEASQPVAESAPATESVTT